MVRLKASTIVESMVAMTIITVVFIVAMTSIGGMTAAFGTAKKYKAGLILEGIIADTEAKRTFYDETIEAEYFNIEKTVKSNPLGKDLLEVELKAYDRNDKFIYSIKKIVYINEDR